MTVLDSISIESTELGLELNALGGDTPMNKWGVDVTHKGKTRWFLYYMGTGLKGYPVKEALMKCLVTDWRCADMDVLTNDLGIELEEAEELIKELLDTKSLLEELFTQTELETLAEELQDY